MHNEHWLLVPEEHDYQAAINYLSLIGDPALAQKIATLLKSATNVIYEAKDLLRASRLPLLPIENVHVAKDLDKVKHGEKLSPILLVRGKFMKDRRLVVADGYHRICTSYWIDEDSPIPCRLVDAPN
jgi:hypothetical protein